jgi:hypothetical protein
MENIDDELFSCTQCSSDVKTDDEFCTHCGSILIDNVRCGRHPCDEASGVCVICCLPCCTKCGSIVNHAFLCETHAEYEMYEGMVRIYGSLNDTSAQQAKTCLDQAGFHPMLFCRVQPKGGPRFVYTLFRSAGDSAGHIINEIKVMVPCQEVMKAEKVLRKLKILETSGDRMPLSQLADTDDL